MSLCILDNDLYKITFTDMDEVYLKNYETGKEKKYKFFDLAKLFVSTSAAVKCAIEKSYKAYKKLPRLHPESECRDCGHPFSVHRDGLYEINDGSRYILYLITYGYCNMYEFFIEIAIYDDKKDDYDCDTTFYIEDMKYGEPEKDPDLALNLPKSKRPDILNMLYK